MKVVPTARDMVACPLCNFIPELLRNASKQFQVRCPNCGARTSWLPKTEAVIAWHDMIFGYLRATRRIKDE